MLGIFMAIIGFLLIFITLYLVLREIRREAEVKFKPDASFYDGMERIDDEVLRLRNEIDGMGESFYELVDGLSDRLNDLKREVSTLKKREVAEEKKLEEIVFDATRNVRKSDSYHKYEMNDYKEKTLTEVKEDRVFPEQKVRRLITKLHSQGKTSAEIAKEVDKGIGEVELILKLLKKR